MSAPKVMELWQKDASNPMTIRPGNRSAPLSLGKIMSVINDDDGLLALFSTNPCCLHWFPWCAAGSGFYLECRLNLHCHREVVDAKRSADDFLRALKKGGQRRTGGQSRAKVDD